MLQQFFSADLSTPLALAITCIVVGAVLGIAAFLLKRMGYGVQGRGPGRGRSGRRLAIVDAVNIDPRRRLVLVRRDDVEHLLLTGGTNDVVVEQNITGGYVAASSLRPAMPQEREAQQQRAVQPPPPRAPLPPRPENPQLAPAATRPEALGPNAVAAALAAPAPQNRMAYDENAGTERGAPVRIAAEPRTAPVEPRPLEEPTARPAIPVARPRPEQVTPTIVSAREIAREDEDEEADDTADTDQEAGQQPSRAEALITHATRLRAQATTLRQRFPNLPPEKKRDVAETIRNIERKASRMLAEGERLKGNDGQAEEEEAPEAPRLSEDAAKRGLAMLLGTERPTARPAAPEAEETTSGHEASAEAERAEAQRAAAERAAAQRAAAEKAAQDRAAAQRAAAERAAAAKAAAEKAAAEQRAAAEARAAALKAAAERAAAEKAAADRAAAERAAAEKAAAEREAAEHAAAERAAAQRAAAEKAAAEKAAAEKAEAERAAAEKAAAERAAAEKAAAAKAAAEKTAAEKAAAEKAEAERAAAEKAAAEKVAAEQALADQIAAEMAAALAADTFPAEEAVPEKSAAQNQVTPPAAVEPRLQEMAQRLDAALARPADDNLRLSLTDLLEDIEGTAAEAPPPVAPVAERPQVPLATRRPATPPRADSKPRAGVTPGDYARFLSDEPERPPRISEPVDSPARGQARELFSDGWMRANRRLERGENTGAKAPEVSVRPSRANAPLPPAAREPLFAPREPLLPPREPTVAPRRGEPKPLTETLPRLDPPAAPPKSGAPAELDETGGFLDEFDAEMADLLGRTPASR